MSLRLVENSALYLEIGGRMGKNDRAEILGMSLLGNWRRFPVCSCAHASDVMLAGATIPFIASWLGQATRSPSYRNSGRMRRDSREGSSRGSGRTAFISRCVGSGRDLETARAKTQPNECNNSKRARAECGPAPAAELRCRFYRLLSPVKQSSGS